MFRGATELFQWRVSLKSGGKSAALQNEIGGKNAHHHHAFAHLQVFADSQNGNSGYYVPIAGSALNNWKLKAFNGGGTEVTAGAYPASVTSDIVQITITARKLL